MPQKAKQILAFNVYLTNLGNILLPKAIDFKLVNVIVRSKQNSAPDGNFHESSKFSMRIKGLRILNLIWIMKLHSIFWPQPCVIRYMYNSLIMSSSCQDLNYFKLNARLDN